jgi:hypothetical protein
MTALHLLAQELLCGEQTIKIKGGETSYSKATKEWPIPESRFRADVAGTKLDNSQFLIEVFVTHKLKDEDDKVKFICENKFHSIEIDLSKVNSEISKDDLLRLLLTDTSKQRIIYSPPTKENSTDKDSPASKDSGPSLFEVLLIGGIAIAVGKWLKSIFTRRRRKR